MRNAVGTSLCLWAAVIGGITGCQDPPTEPDLRQPDLNFAADPQPAHRIAFHANGSDGWQIYTVRDDGTGLTQVTNLPGNVSDPLWSPAGPNRIAFQVYDPVLTWERLAIIRPDGTGLQNLTPAEYEIQAVAWSPAGDKLAFHGLGGQGLGPGFLIVVNADGSGLDTLAQHIAGTVTWSPDGQRIAYFREVDNPRTVPNERGIWTVRPDGTGHTKIRDLPGATEAYISLEFSPDGEKLAACHFTQYGSTLRVMNENGTSLMSLPVGCGWWGHDPRWSPDAARILTAPDHNLYTVAADGTDVVQLTFDASLSNTAGRWSRQGTRIAYVNTVQVHGGTTRGLFTMSPTGGSPKRLTPFGLELSHVGSLSWGP
jgi:Tol biopolymer transport system component